MRPERNVRVTIMVSQAKEFPGALESRGPHTQEYRTAEEHMGIINDMKTCTQSPDSTRGQGGGTHMLWS